MAITTADIDLKLSVNTGPGLSTAQPNPNDSIGGFMSSTSLATGVDNNLFDDVTGDQASAGHTDYRCVFLHNNHATLTWENVKVWVSDDPAGGGTMAIALDTTGVVAESSASAQAERVASEVTAPAGEAFSAPTTKAGGLSVGNMAANTCIAVWVRRTVDAATAAVNGATFSLSYEGDTAA